MNKFSALLAGVAVVAMASCTSDEPMGPTTSPIIDADAVYMAVNISSNSETGKADPIYSAGSVVEQKIDNARFFFFDADGIFVTEANVWAPGSGVDEGTDVNIEYDSNAMIVLKGLKGKEAPRYMFTVINAPNSFQAKATLAETAATASYIKNDEGLFIMSTSTFIPTTGDKAYDAKYPYVNVIQESDFSTEALTIGSDNKVTDKNGVEVKPINIYVERLAAKVSMILPEDNKFEITMTVADDEADKDHNGDVTAKTRLFLEITGMTVANVEPQSYIAKNIEGLDNPLNGWDWNKSADFRSHWAKSMLYGDNFDATKLVGATFADAIENGTDPVYTYETTNTLANVINGADASTEAQRVYDPNVACALITAKIVDEKNNAVDLIKFQGNFYEQSTFVNYILARLNAQPAGLNYYTKTEKEDGTIEYNQIDADCINLSLAGTGIGQVKLTLKPGLTLYRKNADDGTYSEAAAGTAASSINGRIADIITSTNPAEAYAGGNCYYTIPLEHMLKPAKKYYADKEAQFGLVRNHWYQLNISSVSKLGHGIFDPEKEEIKPEIPEDDTYGVAAQIHVLSWKIVAQDVEL